MQGNRRLWLTVFMLLVLTGGLVAFTDSFLTRPNLVDLFINIAIIGTLALGSSIVIISGGIDFSIGAVMILSSVVIGVFLSFWNLPIIVAIFGGIITGALCGLVNGIIIVKMRIAPYIVTLGMMMVAKGLSLVISSSRPIYMAHIPVFRQITIGSVGGIPFGFIGFLVLALLTGVVLSKTVPGRKVYALAVDRQQLAKTNQNIWRIAIYIVNGCFCGIAGFLMTSYLNSAQPSIGQGYEFAAITAAVMGGFTLKGSSGKITGVVIGVFLIGLLANTMKILLVPQEWQTAALGLIFILVFFRIKPQ